MLIATRGAKHGICNICGSIGPLTEDHTPPKGCQKPRAVELFFIQAHLDIGPPKEKGRISQNGVKYRTLCKQCNNHFLGTQYDPDLIRFVNEIGTLLKSPLELPSPFRVPLKPQRVIRSLLGHLSAQGVDRYQKGSITEPLRDYFLDSNLPLPPSINIYCWAYPQSKHVMVRDGIFVDFRIQEPVAFWLLKFFPIGFLVTFDTPKEYIFPAIELSQWRDVGIDYITDLYLPLHRNLPNEYWPEAPSDNTIVAYGREAITSFPRKG